MQSSYRIAVISAVVLLVVIFGYYLKSEKPTTTRNATANTSNETRTINRPPSESLVASNENPKPRSMDELMEKVEAYQNASTPVPGQAAPNTATPAASTASAPTTSAPATHGTTATGPVPTTDLTARTTVAGVPTTQPGSLSQEGSHDADGFPRRSSDIFATTDGDHSTGGARTTSTRSTLAAESSNSPRTHKVASGETFSSIAAKYYGSEKNWRIVAEANPLVDPARLKVGQVIKVPENHASVEASGERSVPAEVASSGASNSRKTPKFNTMSKGTTEYTVKIGDTLSSIARKHYGNADKWNVIYKANRSAIGSNPENVKMGMKLIIPAK